MHLLKVKEAAALLHCHPFSIYSAIYEGRISALKIKGNIRIPADELERFSSCKQRLSDELCIADVCRILSLSRSTVLRLVRDRKLKAVKVSNRYCITVRDLESYVSSLPAA